MLDHPLIYHMIASGERDRHVADARLAAIVRDARGVRQSRRSRLIGWLRRRPSPVPVPAPRNAQVTLTTH